MSLYNGEASVVCLSVRLSVCKLAQIASSPRQMAGSPPNFHKMDSRSACIQGVLKVKVKVKGHVIRALSWILGMSYSVIDGLDIVLSKESQHNVTNTRSLLWCASHNEQESSAIAKMTAQCALHMGALKIFGTP